VGSGFLKKRYGGLQLYHGVDCQSFDPARYNAKQLKGKWGFAGKTVVLFGGIPIPHKGLEDLIAAVKMLNAPSLRVVVIGSNSYTDLLEKIAGDFLVRFGVQPYTMLPELLSLADLIVLPQRNTPYAQAQVPGKLFDAMAMAKPIIATAVSDLPEILSGCGWVVEPGNPTALAEAIEFVLHNPDLTAEMGWKAREKCQDKYSWDAMERVLVPLFQKYSV
jgi:glycosyltransferase involved in cell wall biosynthesis